MTETAKMYGGSLYDLAAEEGLETRILGELDEVQQLLKQNPDYLRLLSTPSIPKKERCGLLDEACLLYTSPSPRDRQKSRMPSSA